MLQRGAVWAAAAGAVAALLCTAVTAHGDTATTAYSVSGTRMLHSPPHPEDLLPAYFAGVDVNRVEYPAALFGMDRSIAVASEAVLAAVDSAAGPLILAGFSQGAVAVTSVKLLLMQRPQDERPAPGQLSFLAIGDPTGPGGIMRSLPFRVPVLGLTPVLAPETPYDTVIVTGEYDGWSDFPDRPWNLVSLANALIGTAYVHGGYETIPGGLDISDLPAQNVSVTTNALGGQTTTYLIPTPKLPLVQPLRDIGIPEPLVAGLEAALKPMVDAGYARHDPPGSGAVNRPVSGQQAGPPATPGPGDAAAAGSARAVSAVAAPRGDAVVEARRGAKPGVAPNSRPTRTRPAAAA